MTELNDNGEYKFVPVVKDSEDKKVYRCKLDEKKKVKYDKAVENKIKRDRRTHMILTAESELIRIIKHLSENNEIVKERDYIPDVLSLKVGRSYTAYKEKMTKSGMVIIYNGTEYKRIIVSSSHSRTQKAMLVSIDVWDKAMDILLCGLDRNIKYKFMSKWNSYIGLAATDSIPVSMPNIVVIDDKEIFQKAKVDVVLETDTEDENGNISRKFEVENDREEDISINLFDGAGLVTVEKAGQWSKELNLDYIPASFQFRCIPCLKGKLYTMPVAEFANTIGSSTIIDIKGKKWDLFNDKIDCILTKSQFKFHDLYDSIENWKECFEEEIYGYKRTFNISSYDEKMSELKKTTVMAYQPLQTSSYTDNEIKKLCDATVDGYINACSSVEGFLKYRGIISDQDENDDIEWSKFPAYYQALYYKHSLFNDEFVQKKIKQDLKSGKERAYVGKIIVSGNYQTLIPDLYALMQHAFGLEVTGLLHGNEVYSNYWNYNLYDTPWIDIIRSPHIANEHCPVQVVTSEEMEKWFRYQKTGIILSVFENTIALKLNSADFDGDHVLTTDNRVICEAARRNNANTIHHIKTDKRKSASSNSNSSNNSGSSSSNSGWGSWFVHKADSYPKSKLRINSSIVDRLKLHNFDSSQSARAGYYKAMGGSGTYVGSASQNTWMISEMRKHGFKQGGTIGKLIRSAGEDGFVLARTGEEILSKEKLIMLKDALQYIPQNYNIASTSLPKFTQKASNSSVDVKVDFGGITMNGVNNPEEFVTELQKSKRFEKIVQSITVDTAMGKNSLGKYKF